MTTPEGQDMRRRFRLLAGLAADDAAPDTATAMIDPAELATLRAELAAARAEAEAAKSEVNRILSANRLARDYGKVVDLMSRVDQAELDLEDTTLRAERAEVALAAARRDFARSEDALVAARAHAAEMFAELVKFRTPCRWKYDSERGEDATGCGHFYPTTGNQFSYCPDCGRRIVFEEPTP